MLVQEEQHLLAPSYLSSIGSHKEKAYAKIKVQIHCIVIWALNYKMYFDVQI